MDTSTPRRRWLCPLLVSLLGVTGCESSSHVMVARPRVHHAAGQDVAPAPEPAARPPGVITIDGNLEDWPGESVLGADENYVYFRFMVQDHEFTLQASPTPVAFMLDADASASTGFIFDRPELKGVGVDLEIEFSPRSQGGQGVAAYALSPGGGKTPVKIEDLQLVFAPTHAAMWFEGRIARNAALLPGLPESGFRSAGHVGAFACTLDASGEPDQYSDPVTTTCPPVGDAGGPRSDATPPSRPPNAIRVVTYNVQKSSPDTKPDTFKRVFQALDPDIVLIQEWEAPNAEHIEGWFTAMVPGAEHWHAITSGREIASGGGAAVVSRFPMEPAAANLSAEGKPVRFVAARVKTPAGDVLAGSAHLKSRGGKDTAEDRRRLAEADIINATLKTICEAPDAPSIRVVAGDLNLVGSRPPLDALAAGLDANGTALAPAETFVLGDRAITTWEDTQTPFTPGRLDYVLYSDASAGVVHAFVLDTRRLSDAALARMGLDRDDSGASDHMPVVVDLVPR